ncbi:hypothetical protein F5B20DRAFT_571342 [Whalleya microplaca]|nr:hypothetical protein F5B20DRAFT_571342 [Whalleya microplaca]
MSSLLAHVLTSKEAIKYGQKVAKLAERYVQPVAKTVEAFQAAQGGLAQLGETTNKVVDLIEKGERLIPSLQVVTESACDKVALLTNFAMVGSAVGFGVHILQQYQGTQALKLIAARLEQIGDTLEAQTTLMAQQLFPQYVYDMVQERLGATSGKCESHWFFIYHPDTDWYPGFCKLVAEKRLGRRFCGWTNQLDTLFLFMMAVRKEIGATGERYKEKGHRPIKFHILVPAYQPVIVTDYLSFPSSDSIGDFVIEGKIHNGHPLVWMNVPGDQERFLHDIGNWKPPPPGLVDWLLQSMGARRKPTEDRRELGTIPVPLLDKNHDGEDDEKQQQRATVAQIEDGHESDHGSIEDVVSRHSKNARRKGLKMAPRDRKTSVVESAMMYPSRKRVKDTTDSGGSRLRK